MVPHDPHHSLYSCFPSTQHFGFNRIKSPYMNRDFFQDSSFKVYNRMRNPFPDVFSFRQPVHHHHCCGGFNFWGGILGGFLGGFAGSFFGGISSITSGLISYSMQNLNPFNYIGGGFPWLFSNQSTVTTTGKDGVKGNDGVDGKDGKTKIVYVDRVVTKESDKQDVLNILSSLDIKLDDIEKIPDEKFNECLGKLTPSKARALLCLLDVIKEDDGSTRPQNASNSSTNYLCGKFYNNYRILKILEKSGVTVEVEYNPTNAAKKDHWITGPISNVKVENKVISYEVDCSRTGKVFNGKYKFTGTDNNNTTFKVQQLDSNGGTTNLNKEFIYQGPSKPLLNNSTVARTAH